MSALGDHILTHPVAPLLLMLVEYPPTHSARSYGWQPRKRGGPHEIKYRVSDTDKEKKSVPAQGFPVAMRVRTAATGGAR